MIQLQKTVTLMLPFRRYPLRLSHRLLTSLGGVSRFMLRALDSGLTMGQLSEVTGLSDTTLVQQLNFLAQHHFVQIDPDDLQAPAKLSERGCRMIEVERLLQRGEQSIWLDAFTLKRHAVHLMASPDPEHLLPDPAGRDFSPYTVAVVPARARSYHAFDEVGRLRTLLSTDVLAELLAAFWPDASDLITEEIDHWEYVLGRQGSQGLDYLSITFEQGTLALDTRADPQNASLPTVLLPLLDLTTRFSRVEGFPWQVTVPAPVRKVIEMVSLCAVPGLAEHPVAEAVLSGEAIVLPASLEDGQPEQIGITQLPPGLSAKLGVRHFQVPCHIDQTAFQYQLHAQKGVQVLSSQHRSAKAEAIA